MRSTFLVVFFCLNFVLNAQKNECDKEISGTIRDIDSGEVLPFATVKIQNSDKGVISNENGEFVLAQICETEVHLEVRFLGYKTIVHHHDFHHSKPVIYLASDETLLESVIIEEDRSDELQTISIQRKQVDKLTLLSSSIGELSEDLTGVSILKTGSNISKPMIHGLHSNRVLVVNDGIRHAYQVWGREHAPEIDPTHVDQIEIVKGAGTVKYGPEALGGVILYNSKKPTFDKDLNGSIGASYQTNGRALNSQLNLSQGYHRFAWDVGAFGIYQGDLDAPDYNLSNTGKREYGGSFNTLLHRPKFDLQIAGSYMNQELGILRASIVGNLDDLQNAINDSIPSPTFDPTYTIQNPKQETEHGLLKSDLSLFLGEHVFNFQYAIQQNIRREFDVRRGELNERPVIDLSLLSHTLETEWIQPANDLWSGNSGIQLFSQNSTNQPKSNPVNFVPDYDVFNLGAFTIQSLDFDKATLELGIRFDFQSLSVADTIRKAFIYSNKVNYANATFTLGLRKQLNQTVSIFSNIGSAWRAPNVAELYSFGYHHSRIQFGLWRYDLQPEISTPPDSVFDQTLRPVPPEKGIKWVAGIELKKKRVHSEFIFYINQINDYIFLRPYGITIGIAGTFPFFIYDQTDALFLGSDWDVKFVHSNTLTSELKVSYVYAISTDKKQPLLEIPPLNLNYTFEHKKGVWSYALKLNYTARQWNAPIVIEPENFSNSEVDIDIKSQIFDFMSPPDHFLLVGAQVAYQKNHWNVAVKSSNLLNSSYRSYTDRIRYFADLPGRNVSFAIQYKF